MMRELIHEPVEPEADQRFSYVSVRRKTEEEIARDRALNAPVTFTCSLCGTEKQAEERRWSRYGAWPAPYPGNICRACVDRLGRSFGFTVNYRVNNRSDFAHMRALAAVTEALLAETRHHAHQSR